MNLLTRGRAVVGFLAAQKGVTVTAKTGANAASAYRGGTTSGAPATGIFNLGDFVVDQTGAIWICTVAGTPGTWVQDGSTVTGTLTAQSGEATTAGGGAAALKMGTGAFGLYFGSGAPTISAAQGSLYIRSDGSSSSTRLYINSNGATTWVAITTAS